MDSIDPLYSYTTFNTLFSASRNKACEILAEDNNVKRATIQCSKLMYHSVALWNNVTFIISTFFVKVVHETMQHIMKTILVTQ